MTNATRCWRNSTVTIYTQWLVMDLHVCRRLNECKAVASSETMRCRLFELTASQRLAIRLLIDLAKRAGLAWDKRSRRGVKAMGMKGCHLGEIALVAFMQEDQVVVDTEATAVPAVAIQHLRHVVDFLVRFDFNALALSPWLPDAARGISRKVDSPFHEAACVLHNCNGGNNLWFTSKERIVQIQRGWRQLLEHLTAPAALTDAALKYFKDLVQASEQRWNEEISAPGEAHAWLQDQANTGWPTAMEEDEEEERAPPLRPRPPLNPPPTRLRAQAPPADIKTGEEEEEERPPPKGRRTSAAAASAAASPAPPPANFLQDAKAPANQR